MIRGDAHTCYCMSPGTTTMSSTKQSKHRCAVFSQFGLLMHHLGVPMNEHLIKQDITYMLRPSIRPRRGALLASHLVWDLRDALLTTTSCKLTWTGTQPIRHPKGHQRCNNNNSTLQQRLSPAEALRPWHYLYRRSPVSPMKVMTLLQPTKQNWPRQGPQIHWTMMTSVSKPKHGCSKPPHRLICGTGSSLQISPIFLP